MLHALPEQYELIEQYCYESLFIRNRSIVFGARQKNLGSSFGLIISFTTKVVTVGITILKLCFTSEFKISRDAEFEHFRKEFPTVPQTPSSTSHRLQAFVKHSDGVYDATQTCP